MKFSRAIIFYLLFFFMAIPIVNSQETPAPRAIYLYTMIGDSASNISLNQAKSLSVDLSGAIYIADTGNNRILKFSKDGELLKNVGGFGWAKEQFYSPYDIHAGSALDVFVADYNNHRIERYDKDLNYISSLYSVPGWDEMYKFGYPRSAATSIHGELFLIDFENIRLLKLNSFGEPEMTFGNYAEGKGRLVQPVQIAISPDDRIYVSDSKLNKIIVFDYFGNYLMEIGSDFLKEPQGIFYSPQKLLFVADQGNKRIAVFNPNGDLNFTLEQISEQHGKFKNPVAVVNFQNRIYILDNDCVFVLDASNLLQTK